MWSFYSPQVLSHQSSTSWLQNIGILRNSGYKAGACRDLLVCRTSYSPIFKFNKLARTRSNAVNIGIFKQVLRLTSTGCEIFCAGNIPICLPFQLRRSSLSLREWQLLCSTQPFNYVIIMFLCCIFMLLHWKKKKATFWVVSPNQFCVCIRENKREKKVTKQNLWHSCVWSCMANQTYITWGTARTEST